MCIIHMRVLCSDKFSELLADDAEQTELAIESIVGTALLEVFDSVLVENVTVHRALQRATIRMENANKGTMPNTHE